MNAANGRRGLAVRVSKDVADLHQKTWTEERRHTAPRGHWQTEG
jgi:hypothetical protein